MNIDAILEGFKLDPINEYEVIFENGDNVIDEIILEFSTKPSVKVKNVFKTIVNAIAKIFKWIGKQLLNIFKWFKNITGKSVKATPDQIIQSTVGNKKGKTSKSTPINTSNLTSDIKSATQSMIKNSEKIKIPSSELSDIKVNDIEVMVKPILLSFSSDSKNEIIINSNNMYGTDKSTVKGQSSAGAASIQKILACIFNFDIIDQIASIADKLLDSANNDISSMMLDAAKNLEKHIEDTSGKIDVYGGGVKITIEDVTKVSKSVNDLMDKISKLCSLEFNTANEDHMSAVNIVLGISSILQMSINALTRTMNGLYIVDKRYAKTINDPKILDEFIASLINAGIPSKYIGYNAYVVASEKIHDGPGSKENPIWGQSRVVLFPASGDVVYKVALSKWGAQANKIESEVSNKVAGTDGEKLFAKVISSQKNQCVNSMERVLSEKPSADQALEVSSSVRKFASENNIGLDLTADFALRNTGNRPDGSTCMIDYGYAWRRSNV